MDNKISTTAIYYTASTLFALAFSGALIVTLDWPLLAEIPLAGAIFIHIIALSRTLYTFWTDHKEQFTDRVASRFKAVLFSLDTNEEEANV